MSSWGETLREYDQSRRTAAWGNDAMPPVNRVTRRDVNLKESMRPDPITNTSRDRGADARREEAGKVSAAHALAASYEKTVVRRQGRRHDIITGTEIEGPGSGRSAAEERAERARLARGVRAATKCSYNILSNEPLSRHSALPPSMRPLDQDPGHYDAAQRSRRGRRAEGSGPIIDERGVPVPEVDPLSGLSELDRNPRPVRQPRQVLEREHDILSNDPYDPEKAEREEAVAEAVALETAAASAEFDPLLGRFQDPDRDARELELEMTRTQGLRDLKQSRVPHGLRYSEGAAFDITSGTVRDERAAEEVRAVEARSTNRLGVAPAFEARQKRLDLERQARQSALSLNRVSRARDLEAVRHGRDIITNEPYYGIGAKPPPALRAPPRPARGRVPNPHERPAAGVATYSAEALEAIAAGGDPGNAAVEHVATRRRSAVSDVGAGVNRRRSAGTDAGTDAGMDAGTDAGADRVRGDAAGPREEAPEPRREPSPPAATPTTEIPTTHFAAPAAEDAPAVGGGGWTRTTSPPAAGERGSKGEIHPSGPARATPTVPPLPLEKRATSRGGGEEQVAFKTEAPKVAQNAAPAEVHFATEAPRAGRRASSSSNRPSVHDLAKVQQSQQSAIA